MIYNSKADWKNAKHKRVTLIGMSGLGKTYLSDLLRDSGSWFHYSVDFRIGTRYMGEYIVDNFKREAMKVPFLAEHLMSDSIYIASNITFENLAPLSRYLGKPGDPSKGGIGFEEYMRRQEQHSGAEIAATLDAETFIYKAREIYGYDHFVCDTSGSICEIVDANDPNDAVLKKLADQTLIIWLKGKPSHTQTLIERFDKAPKPMFTRREKMIERWNRYLSLNRLNEEDVDPDTFIRWSYAEILEDRLPSYEAIAQNWGITIDADAFHGVTSAQDIEAVIEGHLT